VLPKSSTSDIQNKGAVELGPRVYLNGFPKSGLHLAELMARGVAGPTFIEQDDGSYKHWNWTGSFHDYAWTTRWVEMPNLLQRFEDHPPGTLLKGHCGYRPEIERKLYEGGQAVAFIYRDLRDVVVSQAHHVISDKESHVHPGKELYKALDDFEDVLYAVIVGLDIYPGLIERWDLYAPWLEVDWVYCTCFEMMLYQPEMVVDSFVRYVYHRAVQHYGVSVELDANDVAARVASILENMKRTDTLTFRKGKTGAWREHFTPRIKEAFKEHAGDWLVELGYEKDDNW
jgi:hypothetical protein